MPEARMRLPMSLKTVAILCLTTPMLWLADGLLFVADLVTGFNKVLLGAVHELLAMTDEAKELYK